MKTGDFPADDRQIEDYYFQAIEKNKSWLEKRIKLEECQKWRTAL